MISSSEALAPTSHKSSPSAPRMVRRLHSHTGNGTPTNICTFKKHESRFQGNCRANDKDQAHQALRDYFLSPPEPILVPKVMEQQVLHWSHHGLPTQHTFQSPPLYETPSRLLPGAALCSEEEDSWHLRERLISRMLEDVSSPRSSAVGKRLLWNLAAATTARMVPTSMCREGKQKHPEWSGTEQPLPQSWALSGVAAPQATLMLQTGHGLIQCTRCAPRTPWLW